MRAIQLAVACAVLLVSGQVQAGIITIEPAPPTSANGGGNGFPLSSSNMRWQQAYRGAEFGGGPVTITSMGFLGTNSPGAVSYSGSSDFSVKLSTTNSTIDGLSSLFANNTGGDETEVFAGPISFSSVVGSYGSFIPFTTPFVFDPSAGNLLVEISHSGTAGSSAISNFAYLNSGDPEIGIRVVNTSSPTATSGTVLNRYLATQFVTADAATVPEPTSLALLATGAFGFMGYGWRRKRKLAA